METLSRSRAPSGFRDRREAGRLLARELMARDVPERAAGNLVVIGLARGGVEVAAEIAAVLHAPFDALAVRKIGHPLQPEYGIGAVAPGGIEYIRAPDGLTVAELAEAVHAAEGKVAALDARLHERRGPVSVTGATCILVDDGLATGGTMIAAVRWARAQGARRVVVAVPAGAAATVTSLERDEDVDAVVCLLTPVRLHGGRTVVRGLPPGVGRRRGRPPVAFTWRGSRHLGRRDRDRRTAALRGPHRSPEHERVGRVRARQRFQSAQPEERQRRDGAQSSGNGDDALRPADGRGGGRPSKRVRRRAPHAATRRGNEVALRLPRGARSARRVLRSKHGGCCCAACRLRAGRSDLGRRLERRPAGSRLGQPPGRPGSDASHRRRRGHRGSWR